MRACVSVRGSYLCEVLGWAGFGRFMPRAQGARMLLMLGADQNSAVGRRDATQVCERTNASEEGQVM